MRTFFPLLLRTLLAVCFGALTWSFSSSAWAQTSNLQLAVAKVDRVKGEGDLPTHPNGLKNTDITLADCTSNVIERFSLTVTGTVDSSHNMEVWASNSGDCTQYTSRQFGTAGATCWRVANNPTVRNGTIVVDVPIKDLASQLGVNPKVDGIKRDDPNVCSTAQSTPGAQTITVYFLWVAGGTNADSSTNSQVSFDTRGPAGPTDVRAGEGDRVIVMNWTPASSSGSDISGYIVYCAPSDTLDAAPPPIDAGGDAGDGGGTDAGVKLVCDDAGATDAGADSGDDGGDASPVDAGDPPPGCHYEPIVPDGGTPNNCPTVGLNAPIKKTVGSSVSSGVTVDGLTNGIPYACAVAAYDKARNPGDLSSSACATPGPVKDFFWRYRSAGGEAGGCALEGAPLTDGVMIGGASVAALAVMRRRRKGKRS